MSFTSDTKRELMDIEHENDCCKVASLSALLAINGYLSLSSEGMRLVFQTSSLPLARKTIQSLKGLYPVEVQVITKQGVRLKKQNQYLMVVKDKVTRIVRELGLMDEESGYAKAIDDAVVMKECCQRAYLRGAFLASGSINHPRSSSYHLEISVEHESYAKDLRDLMNEFDFKAKTLRKKQRAIVYIKDSEKIGDFLRFIGASNALFSFEDERIKRDFINSITRVMNMEIANQNKTFAAADRQLKEIAVLENLLDVDTLPKSMREAMYLRKKFPEASLSELSELSEEHLQRKISKSALNHRFRNVSQKAAEALEAYYEEG